MACFSDQGRSLLVRWIPKEHVIDEHDLVSGGLRPLVVFNPSAGDSGSGISVDELALGGDIAKGLDLGLRREIWNCGAYEETPSTARQWQAGSHKGGGRVESTHLTGGALGDRPA